MVNSRTYFPLGCAVELISDNRHVFEAAEGAWSGWNNLFCTEPMRLHVRVMPGAAERVAPVYRRSGDSVAFEGTGGDMATYSAASGEACIHVHESALSNPAWFLWHYLDAIVFTAFGSSYFTPIHAGCVSLDGRGILLCGDSGAGESSLAYACATRGWTLTSEDSVYMAGGADRVVAGSPFRVHLRESSRLLFPELRQRAVEVMPNGKRAIRLTGSDLAAFSRSRQSRASLPASFYGGMRKRGPVSFRATLAPPANTSRRRWAGPTPVFTARRLLVWRIRVCGNCTTAIWTTRNVCCANS